LVRNSVISVSALMENACPAMLNRVCCMWITFFGMHVCASVNNRGRI
jgi:hypothetical protein